MKTLLKSFLFGLTSLSMFSCASNEVTEEQQSQTKVTFSVDEFISSDATTRSSVNPSNNYAVTWASGDVIGIFPREGYQEPFSIPADQVGQSKASFDGGYWSLKNGLTYNAYYPFDKANFESAESKTTIPVTYLGQSQTGTACNAGAFDYTYSDWTEATSGSVNFKFHHLGAFLVLTLKMPATSTYTSLTLNANSAVIPTKGTYDLTAASPAFTSTAKASSITMTLNSFSGTAGEDATFYMMMPPCDLSSATLTATLATATTSCTYDITSQNIQAAHLYKVTGTPKESSVDGTIDGWVTEELPKINGHEYVEIGGKKWATMNIGATTVSSSAETSYGDYYAWGETDTYYSTVQRLTGTYPEWKATETGNGYHSVKTGYDWLNYCGNSSFTEWSVAPYSTTNKNLNATYDAASVLWGSSWRMPTLTDWNNLFTACGGTLDGSGNFMPTYATSTTDLTTKGIYHIKSGVVNGYSVSGILYVQDSSHTLFIPFAGYLSNSQGYMWSVGTYGGIWLSSIYTSDFSYAHFGELCTSGMYPGGRQPRYKGFPIRPISE